METDNFLEIPCPSCHVRNRVPFGHGKIEITCGRCGKKYIADSGYETSIRGKKKSNAVRNCLLILLVLIGGYIGIKHFSNHTGNVITGVSNLFEQEGASLDSDNVTTKDEINLPVNIHETSERYIDDVSENIDSTSKIDETIIVSSKEADAFEEQIISIESAGAFEEQIISTESAGAFEEQIISTESVFAIKEQALKTAYSSGKIYYEDAVSIMGCNANEKQVFENCIYYIWYVDNSSLAIKVKVDSAGDESIIEIESENMASME